jgi:hypothetical protein
MLCLPIVGFGTIISIGVSAAFWMLSALTLALMILAVLWDFGRAANSNAI